MKNPSFHLIAIALAFAGSQVVPAQEIFKENNTTALNLEGSWQGGIVPGSGNVAVYNTSTALTTELGSDLSWQGIRHVGGASGATWTITGANALTLGSGGIVMTAGGAGFVGIDSALVQSADATYATLVNRNIYLNGALSGSGNINVTGNGLLALNGNNSSYTGAFTIATVTSVGSNTALGTQALTMNNGARLNAGGAHRTLANNIIISTGAVTLEAVNNTRNLTLNGSLSGSGNVTIAGTGDLTLGGNNSGYSGQVTVNGRLLAGSNNALGTGALTMNNGSLLSVAANSATLANNITIATGATVTIQSANVGNRNLLLEGTLSGSGNIVVVGTGSNTGFIGNNSGYTGQITASAGARVMIGSDTALGTQTFIMNNGSRLFGSATGSRTLANNISVDGSVIFEAVNTSRNLTLNGVIEGTGAITKVNAGILTLNGANTYTGDTTVSGGTLNLSATSELRFALTDVGSNSVLGTGIANFNGLFRLDISGLTSTSGTWSLVNVGTLTESFGSSFGLAFVGGPTFTDAGSGFYTSGDWTFNTSTGNLTVVPEPSTWGLLLGSLLILVIASRRFRSKEA